MPVAEDWAANASQKKQIPAGSPLEGEEWFSGPYALLSACNNFIATLEAMDGGSVAASCPDGACATARRRSAWCQYALGPAAALGHPR